MAALSAEMMDEITRLVKPLKDERDTWKATAQAYKAAFEAQTARLAEAVELCMATSAELAKLREQFLATGSSAAFPQRPHSTKHSYGSLSSHTLVGDTGSSHKVDEWQSTPITKATFGHVEKLLNKAEIIKAREEIDRILPGRLSHEARIEGLLLKSAICRASGPDWALEGLAQCSEAMTLCEKISSLSSLLPKINYHRGLCLMRLRQLEQARDAFAAVGPTHPLHDGATKYRRSCDDEIETFGCPNRRSGFDERRTITEGFLSHLKEAEGKRKRRPSSTRVKFFSISKGSRRSLSQRWMHANAA